MVSVPFVARSYRRGDVLAARLENVNTLKNVVWIG